MRSLLVGCQWLAFLSFSIVVVLFNNEGKRNDRGLDDNDGEFVIHPLDCESGDKGHEFDKGGVTGNHMGASADSNDDGVSRAIDDFNARQYLKENDIDRLGYKLTD